MSKSLSAILVASDNAEEIKLVTKSLRSAYPGCRVEAVYSVDEVLDCASREEWPVILIDEVLPRQSGVDILPDLKSRAPRSVLVLQAERNDSEVAVQAMRAGADYYMWKKSPTFLLDLPIVITEVLEKQDLRTRLDLANERYRRLIENMTDLVYELDQDGRFVYVSPTVEDLLGYSANELIGLHYGKLIAPQDSVRATQRFNERRTGARGTRNLELKFLHKESKEGAPKIIDAEVNAVGLHGPHRRFLGTVGVVQSLAKRKREEAQLQQLGKRLQHAERLKELGQFIAGIAHELNNPLTSICGYADLMLNQVDNPRLVTQLKTVASEASRAAQIVKELLLFARPQQVERTAVAVSQLVDRVVALKSQDLEAHSIRTEVRLGAGTPLILCDENQLQQVLLNLITNAQHAMWEKDRGGRLIIASRTVSSPHNRPWVELEVIDSGPGIPSEDRRRIFTPFFTKKKGGQGTGLGLAIVERLVQENGGSIEADDAPGGGARFRIRLQAVEQQTLSEPKLQSIPGSSSLKDTNVSKEEAPSAPSLPISDKETRENPHVIVVEDERSIRYLISTVLAQEGFRVTVCENGQQGIQQVKQALGEWQGTGEMQDPALILSDFKMPGMNGREFFGELRKVTPDLIRRLVFITGDTMNTEIAHLIEQTGNTALAKPFTPSQLVQTVRKAMGSRSSARVHPAQPSFTIFGRQQASSGPSYRNLGSTRDPNSGSKD
jgi:two-component system NtrC family sensor kinase